MPKIISIMVKVMIWMILEVDVLVEEGKEVEMKVGVVEVRAILFFYLLFERIVGLIGFGVFLCRI